jgi:hypothetical protein
MTDDDGRDRTRPSVEWRDQYGDVVDGPGKPYRLGQYVDDEQNAVVIRSYEPELIPGLLQLPEITSVIAQNYFPHLPEAERRAFVRAREARAELLKEPNAPRFSVFVSEAALRKDWGSPEAHRKQLGVLAEELDGGGRQNVDVRIVPAAKAPSVEAFVVMSLKDGGDVLWRETRDHAERIDAAAEAERAARSLDDLANSAYAPAKARDLIKEIQASLG